MCAIYVLANSYATEPTTERKPHISVILADWGIHSVHSDIEKKCPTYFALALHILGKPTAHSTKNPLLIHVPTLQQISHATTYKNKLDKSLHVRLKGVWIESCDGEGQHIPEPPIYPYLVFSEAPLHPAPPTLPQRSIIGNVWIPSHIPLKEREILYQKALEYGQKSGGCVISISITTHEAWEHFHAWVRKVSTRVNWCTLMDYEHLVTGGHIKTLYEKNSS